MTVHGVSVTVFVVLAVVGFVVCLVSFVFDGVFEAFEVDIAGGFLSLTSLSGGLALFGLAATLAQTSFGWTTLQATGFGAAVGLATMAGVGVSCAPCAARNPRSTSRSSAPGESSPPPPRTPGPTAR